MLEITNISEVGYYVKIASEAVLSGNHKIDQRAEKGLYFDRDVAGLTGRWVRLKDAGFQHNKDRFPKVVGGATVDATVLHSLAQGRVPGENRILSAQSGDRRAGLDLTFSAPKDVSALLVCASSDGQRAIIEAQQIAVKKALEFAFSMSLFETRSGKAGVVKNSAIDVPTAVFTHFVSRAGDPQLHSHVVVPNMAVDGGDFKIRALDPKKLFQWKAAIGAAYRCELANELRKELGVGIKRDERNFAINGVPSELKSLFSKRRKEIVRKMGPSRPTATNRAAARNAALRTRVEKGPPEFLSELVKKWTKEASAHGMDPLAIGGIVRSQGQASAQLNEEERRKILIDKAREELDEALEKTSVMAPSMFYKHVFEAGQAFGSIADICRTMPVLAAGLVKVTNERGAITNLVSKSDISLEHEMCRAVRASRGQWNLIGLAQNQIDDRTQGLSDEQRAAVVHALNKDCLSIVEGAAGSGKSYSMGAFTDICRGSGLNVFVCAPSNKARDIIAADTKTSANQASSLQKLAAQIRAGKTLAPTDVVIVDEAGMASLRDLSAIIIAATTAKAKVVLTGDTRQLLPVGSGTPMLGLLKDIGSARIFTIRRQQEQWMRDASMLFADRNAAEALDAYESRGHLAFHKSSQDTIKAAADDALSQIQLKEGSNQYMLATIIAPRRQAVRDLNAAVRSGLQSKGLLGTPVIVETCPLGEKDAVSIELAQNDRIVFGENLKLSSEEVSNGETGTVILTTARNGKKPLIRIELDRKSEDKTSIFIDLDLETFATAGSGRRGPLPILQHAYAVTTHVAQGLTTSDVIVVNTAPMAADQLYVAMTRHRKTVKLHVAADRFLEPGNTKKQRGGANAPNSKSPIRTEQSTLSASERAEVFQRLKHEAMRPVVKLNPSDLLAHRELWLAADDPVAEFVCQQKSTSPKSQIENRIASRRLNPGSTGINTALLSQFNKAELHRIDQALKSRDGNGLSTQDIEALQRLTTIQKASIRNGHDLWRLNPIARANHAHLKQLGEKMLQAVRTVTQSLQATVKKIRQNDAQIEQTKAAVMAFAATMIKSFSISKSAVISASMFQAARGRGARSINSKAMGATPEKIAISPLRQSASTTWPLLRPIAEQNISAQRRLDTNRLPIVSRPQKHQKSPECDIKRTKLAELNKPSTDHELPLLWRLWSIKRQRARLDRLALERAQEQQKRQKQRGGWER
jgi:conjugative relaxase-like TrwC/TraI family protein